MAAVKERQQSVCKLIAVKKETFRKSFQNNVVIEIEEWKEMQAVYPSQDRHGTLELGPMKSRPSGLAKEMRRSMARKASKAVLGGSA